MCGRFTLVADAEVLKNRFSLKNMDHLDVHKRYNIAPTQDVLTVIHDGLQNKAGFLRWGLIPHWTKDKSIGNKMINARVETINTKPSFRTLLERRRCLVIADGFYEWKKMKEKKQPYHILLKTKEPFAFAGLWDKWEDGNEVIYSCTIITTKSSGEMEDIHTRMPIILDKEQEEIWLDRSMKNTEVLKNLLTVDMNEERLDYYKVSSIVNSPKVDNEACLTPFGEETMLPDPK